MIKILKRWVSTDHPVLLSGYDPPEIPVAECSN